MGNYRGNTRCRIGLTEEDKEMLAVIGEVLQVTKKTPQFGNTLAAFFRMVMRYAEDNPESDLAYDLKRRIESARRKKRKYVRRGPAAIADAKAQVKAKRDAARLKIVAEDYTVPEAHVAALHMEGTRLVRRKRRAKRSKAI